MQGAFKMQLRKGSTCLNEGLTLGIASISMGLKSVRSSSEDDAENFNDVLQMYMRKCNYADSVQMTVFNNFLINRMDQSSLKLLSVPATALKIIDYGSIIGDVVESAMNF